MKKSIFLITTIFLLLFSEIIFANKPAENSLGICDVWFSKDSLNWENATAYTSLKLGQPFYVKIWVKTKTDLKSISYHMSCYGPPYDFELLEKPSNLPSNAQLYDFDPRAIGDITFWNPEKYDEHIMVWKMRVKPDSDFIEGNVPLNIDFEFFGKNTESFYFTVVSVNIINETWSDYKSSEVVTIYPVEDSYESSVDYLGFQLIFVIIFLILLLFFKKRKQQNN